MTRSSQSEPSRASEAALGDTLVRDSTGLFRKAETIVRARFLDTDVLHYRISGYLGRGGMGEVYRAFDTRLGRDVAIKFLLSDFAAFPDYRARIDREARAIARCQHPSICTIYDVGEYQQQPFLVLELLSGETLEAHLERGPIPLACALRWSVAIASALAAAHAASLIHRDIKPSNIFISNSGQVKLLDFGVVLFAAGPGIAEGDIENPENRYLAGSAHYLSPEQCRLEKLEPSSDVFSFGVVLYQMLTGQRPFGGRTFAELQTAIEREDPPSVRSFRPEVSPALSALVAKAFSKDKALRYRDGEALLAALDAIVEESAAEPFRLNLRKSKAATRRVAWLSGLLLLAVVVFAYLLLQFGQSERVSVSPLWGTDVQGENTSPALSPDGQIVAYSSNRSGRSALYLQNVATGAARTIAPDAAADLSEPAFSPDGQQLAFFSRSAARSGIFTIGLRGGVPQQVTGFGRQPSWSPSGTELAFTTEAMMDPTVKVISRSALWIAEVPSRSLHSIYDGDAVQARWSPHGSRIAFVSVSGGLRRIGTISRSGQQPVFFDSAGSMNWSPEWSPDGRYLYFCSDRSGSMNLWRQRVDESSGRALQAPQFIGLPADYAGQLALSRDGRMLSYSRDTSRTSIYRASISPAGTLLGEPESLHITSHRGLNVGISVAPDSRTIAYTTERYGEHLFLAEPFSGALTQLTDTPYRDQAPRFSPDGRAVAFQSNRSGKWEIWSVHPDGSGLQQLTRTRGEAVNPIWSPDNRTVAFSIMDGGAFVHTSSGTRPLSRPLASGQSFLVTCWSPDGRSIAGSIRLRDGTSLGIGLLDIASGQLQNLTQDGGETPVWMQDSGHLLYRKGASIQFIDLATRETHAVLDANRFRVFSRISYVAQQHSIYFTDLQRQTDVIVAKIN